MPDFIAPNTLSTIAALVRDLNIATAALTGSLNELQHPSTIASAQATVTPQAFVEQVLALDEQLSRTRLLLPLCTTGIGINDQGRSLSLSDLLMESRNEFDSLARAQLEVLIEGAPE